MPMARGYNESYFGVAAADVALLPRGMKLSTWELILRNAREEMRSLESLPKSKDEMGKSKASRKQSELMGEDLNCRGFIHSWR